MTDRINRFVRPAIRTLVLAALFALCAGVVFAGGAGEAATADQTFELRLATVVSPPHPWVDMAEFFAEEVRERTDGNVTVRIHHSGALGNDEATIDEMRIGSIDFVIGGVSNAVSFLPEYQITGFSYLFEDLDHFRRVTANDSPFFEYLVRRHEERNLPIQLLALAGGGTRVTSTNIGGVTHPDDLNGVRIRLPGNPLEARIWEEFGALPTSLPWGEIYTAVQTGLVNAFESTISGYYGSRLYEVAPHQSLTNHQIMISHFTGSQRTLDRLPQEYRQVIEEVAAVAGQMGTDKGAEYDQTLLEEMQAEHNVQVHAVDTEPFIQRVRPLHDELARQAGVTTLLEIVREMQ